MLKWFLAFILSVAGVLPSTAHADDRDGRWWNRLERAQKLSYVAGFFDGAEYFSAILAGATLKAMADPKTGKFSAARAEVAKATSLGATQTIEDNLNNLTAGQVVEGLDTTYGDYRNQGIAVSSCVYVVIFAIKGGSEADIARLLEVRRKNAGK